ncbi:MAG: hypothetical protein IIV02_00605 [Peptococcaceae bacterium]|nr:hypothetical protein [Peptococcaceae bacterium]MBQ5658011.1 hypothetical protein [Peptococcaceae bacterium]
MSDLNLKVTVPNELAGELFQKGLASVIDRCTVSVMGAEEKPSGLKWIESEKAEETRAKRKLIKFVCPDCGRFNFAVVEESNKKYEMTCYGCKREYTFTNMELIKAGYTCSECESQNYFFTPYIEDMEVKEDHCKCGHNTRLRYSVAKGCFEEA